MKVMEMMEMDIRCKCDYGESTTLGDWLGIEEEEEGYVRLQSCWSCCFHKGC
jgi:formate dehydrogenase maturation protein FdhE